MYFYWFLLLKIYHIFFILYLRLDVSWINSIKSVFIFIFLRLRGSKNLYKCLFFFFFFFSHLRFWTDCQKFFGEHCKIIYQGSVWPRFIDTTKSIFEKLFFSICYSWRVWLVKQLIRSIEKSQKIARNPETSYQANT